MNLDLDDCSSFLFLIDIDLILQQPVQMSWNVSNLWSMIWKQISKTHVMKIMTNSNQSNLLWLNFNHDLNKWKLVRIDGSRTLTELVLFSSKTWLFRMYLQVEKALNWMMNTMFDAKMTQSDPPVIPETAGNIDFHTFKRNFCSLNVWHISEDLTYLSINILTDFLVFILERDSIAQKGQHLSSVHRPGQHRNKEQTTTREILSESQRPSSSDTRIEMEQQIDPHPTA